MICKICKKNKSNIFFNTIPICTLCNFLINNNKKSISELINNLSKKIGKRNINYCELLINSYQDILISKNIISKDKLQNLRKEIFFSYQKEMLKINKKSLKNN